MLSFEKVKELQHFLEQKKIEKVSIGFVPTMGALHSGHLSLIKRACVENDLVVCSIFVNPIQFNNQKDLENYPRPIDKDIALLKEAGCDILFVPTSDQIYPLSKSSSAQTNQQSLEQYNNEREPLLFRFDEKVFEEQSEIGVLQHIEKQISSLNFGILNQVMEAKHRPGHFDGVVKVVYRLFDIIKPDKAYFGEKDFQQLAIIESMARQLFLPVHIVPCPIIRESDGLAMSSRNQLLTEEERNLSSAIYKTLQKAKELSKTLSVNEVKSFVTSELGSKPSIQLEYFEVSDVKTLAPITNWNQENSIIGCIAAFVGKVRLIDNIIF